MAAQEADPFRVAHNKTYPFRVAHNKIYAFTNTNGATLTDSAANSHPDGDGDWFYHPGHQQCGQLH